MSETPPSPPPPEPRPSTGSPWDEPWDQRGDEERNTGLPASTPYTSGEWGDSSQAGQWEPPPRPEAFAAPAGQRWGQPGQQWARPAFAPPDPAAVSGPPWPTLVAVGHYVPPRMIRWPAVVGFLALATWIGIVVVVSGSTTISQRAWLAEHTGTINTIKQDQVALNADNPAEGGSVSKWLADWQTLHSDVAAAASLPNPGGSATAPWREMINDFYNGSTEILQAVRSRDQTLLTRAERDVAAGYQAAGEFDRAMGLRSS